VTYVQAPKIRHIDCNELARSLLPGCLVYFLSVRSVAKDRARTARSRAPTERCQDKRREVRGGQPPRIIGSKSELLRTRVAASSEKRRVLALPVLYRSGAPVRIKQRTPMLLILK
jgi:hypothetical protein